MRSLILVPVILCILLATPAKSCRMLAVIAEPGESLNTRDSEGELNPVLQAEINEFQLQGGSGNWPYSNRDGWGLTSYYGHANLREVAAARSALPAFVDSSFTAAVHDLLEADSTTIFMGHLRQVSSGANDIENPHPFIFITPGGTIYTFAHNGDLNKDDLRELIGDAWLTLHPPQTYGNGPWNGSGWDAVVDSELFLFWIMVNTEAAGTLQEGLQTALAVLETELPGQIKNFILSDGNNLYVYRCSPARDIYYFDGNSTVDPPWYLEISGHRAVMSTPPPSGPAAGFPWTALGNHQLLILEANGNSTILSISTNGYLASRRTSPEILETLKSYPNPFNDRIHITIQAQVYGPVTLSIYNLSGRLVYQTAANRSTPGEVHFDWAATDKNGTTCASGMYVYVLEGAGWHLSQKILLLK